MTTLLQFCDVRTASGHFQVKDLVVFPEECVGIYGLDSRSREMLIQLSTGAGVAEEGTVFVLQKDTRQLDEPAWFDVVTCMAVVELTRLQEEASIGINLASRLTGGSSILPEPRLSAAVLALSRLMELTIMDLATRTQDAALVVRFKAALGREIAGRPRLLFINVENADSVLLELLPRVLKRVCRVCGTAIILFSSDVRLLSEAADRVLFLELETGRCVEKLLRGWYHKLLHFLPLSESRRQDLTREALQYDERRQSHSRRK